MNPTNLIFALINHLDTEDRCEGAAFVYLQKTEALIMVAVKEAFVAILQMSHFPIRKRPLVDSQVLFAGMDYNTFQNYRQVDRTFSIRI